MNPNERFRSPFFVSAPKFYPQIGLKEDDALSAHDSVEREPPFVGIVKHVEQKGQKGKQRACSSLVLWREFAIIFVAAENCSLRSRHPSLLSHIRDCKDTKDRSSLDLFSF